MFPEVDGIGEEELVEDDEEDDETDEEVEEEEDEDREEHIDNLDGAMSNTEAGQSIGERILHSLLMSKRLNTRKGRAAKVLNFLNGINFSLTHPFCPFAYTNGKWHRHSELLVLFCTEITLDRTGQCG